MNTGLPRRSGRIGLWLAFAAAVAGCTAVTGEDGRSSATNLPAIGVTDQSLGFSVLARDFTFEDHYASPTRGDSLVVGLAVTGDVGGSVLIEVTDSTGAMSWQRTVTQGVAQGQTTIHGTPPYTVHLRFTAFSGSFALAVAAQQ